jgi:very-short-patch-repair endonuclease
VIEEFGHKVVRVSDADVEQVIDSVATATRTACRAPRS